MSRRNKSGWGALTKLVVGSQDNPMLKRWRLIQTPIGGVYVHFIYREDLDRDLHDHPWNFFRFILRGGYEEDYEGSIVGKFKVLKRFDWGYVRTDAHHRITKVYPKTVTLVVVGRKTQEWGFWVPIKIGPVSAKRKIVWYEYLGLGKQ
jgi:hypothetical protein